VRIAKSHNSTKGKKEKELPRNLKFFACSFKKAIDFEVLT
jgi:hypothetical protein